MAAIKKDPFGPLVLVTSSSAALSLRSVLNMFSAVRTFLSMFLFDFF